MKTVEYGAPITLEQANSVIKAGIAEAQANGWNMVIAILDSSGHLVALQRMDNTQYASVDVAQDKAKGAIYFKRPTKVFQDIVAGGGEGLRMLAMRHVCPVDGGLPLIIDGKIIGAIGVSGAQSHEDGQVAAAAAKAVTAQD